MQAECAFACSRMVFTYPDVVVVRGESRFLDDEKENLLNPDVIIEVYENIELPA
jgi:Uma2 family endonuclease